MSEFVTGPLTLQEMIKILSLFENPKEAEGVRRALRFYDMPKNLELKPYQWGETERVRAILEHFALPQNTEELQWMLGYVKGSMSLLEVGSSFGGTLKQMASVMPRGAKIVSVDLDCDDTPKFLNPLASLKETCRQLGLMGASVELIIGNSHSAQVVNAVSNYAPFDFVFIDGDHTYDGVKQDWENYGPMGRIVGFHDIAGVPPEVKRFWDELKAEGQYRTEEKIAKPNGKSIFGIGLVFMED